MSDDDTDPDPIVTKSITIAEMMDGDGDRWISIDPDPGVEPWDALGLLLYAVESYKAEVRQDWSVPADDEDD